MQFLRKIFFYLFAAIYIVLCPLLILYALGYLFTPGGETPFIKTGVIYLATNPPGAEVSVSGEVQQTRTPTLVQALVGGDYSVNIKLEGYQKRDEVIPVEEEKATVLDKILLLPDKWEKKEVLKGPFKGLKAVPGSGYLLLFAGPTAADVVVFSMSTNTAQPLFSDTAMVETSRITDIRMAKGSTVLLVGMKTAAGEKTYWVKLREERTSVKEITDILPRIPENILWQDSAEEDFLYLNSGDIVRINAGTGAVYPAYIKDVRGFGLFNGSIYVLSGKGSLYITDYDLGGKELLLDDADLIGSIFGETGTYLITPLSEEYIAFEGEKGALLLNKLPYRFIDSGVKKLDYNAKKERLLAAGSDRIGAIDLTEEKTGDVAFEQGPKFVWVKEGGKNIKQAFWVYEASHVLYQEKNALTLVDIEAYGEFKSYALFKVKKGSEVFFSENTGEIYFLSQNEGNLLGVELVQPLSVMPDPFDFLPQEQKQNRIEER